MTDILESCSCNTSPASKSGGAISPAVMIPDLDLPTSEAMVYPASTEWTWGDRLGAWKARWAIGRMNYRVEPGLYQLGDADKDAPVLVTANYKMSFDLLRRELKGIKAWILVLDTDGINVWCAAGKGTFGTAELVKRIALTGLASQVAHRTLILPQLGAPGVSAHKVKAISGFKVVYGPVRAADLPAFLKAGMKAAPHMRQVRFDIADRLATTPVELVLAMKPVAIVLAVLILAHILGLLELSWYNLYPFLGAVLAGTVATPALLPWIPGRAFAFKGWLVGLLWTIITLYANARWGYQADHFVIAAQLLLYPVISSFLAMNFTGASTYTSPSGVAKEMKYAVPMQATAAALGLLAGLAHFINNF